MDSDDSPIVIRKRRPQDISGYFTTTKSQEKVPRSSEPMEGPILFRVLTGVFNQISGTRKRLEIQKILGCYFKKVLETSTQQDLIASVYITLNRVAPDYEGIELGVGDSILLKAIAESTGRTLKHLRSELQRDGDIGILAEKSRCRQSLMFKPAPLTVMNVFNKLKTIATTSGKDSQSKKLDLIKSTLIACEQGHEARFFIRALSGKLRIGLAEQTVITCLAHAFGGRNDEEAVEIVKSAINQCPDYGRVIEAMSEFGIERLGEHCLLECLTPIKPMLAHPVKSIEDVLKRMPDSPFICEHKYDGERAQIHIKSSDSSVKVRIFSRNSEDNTTKYPDVIDLVKRIVDENRIESAILDCEIVAFDSSTGRPLPFQVLSHRKRKNVESSEITVKVCLFVFDILYLNSKSMIGKETSLKTRREALQSSFRPIACEFEFARGSIVMGSDRETAKSEIKKILEQAISDGTEGLMVKSLDSPYEPSKRSFSWLKVKKDYVNLNDELGVNGGLADTLDLVIMGAYLGAGKRTGVYGGFLLGCFNEESDEYESLCKIGTGFKDEDLASLKDLLEPHKSATAPIEYTFDDSLKCDVWFEPKLVCEVKCADLSVSPVHFGALGRVDADKGISLRFPRFIRLRDDKRPNDATTSDQVAIMYMNQEQLK